MNKLLFLGLMALAPLLSAQPKLGLTTEVKATEDRIILADTFGRSLYVFDVDTGNTTSQCTGNCAEVWPPYIITDEEASALVAPHGIMARPNGKLQLTFNGSPVYTYDLDREVGGELGDGVGGVWHSIEIQ